LDKFDISSSILDSSLILYDSTSISKKLLAPISETFGFVIESISKDSTGFDA